mmetsp:Transcript_13153/g.30739  ORF Transcript_13153/g.30739 Transcript_13153/m.30739 type:complete len:406 (+) Transcript_13153:73-1290(+)
MASVKTPAFQRRLAMACWLLLLLSSSTLNGHVGSASPSSAFAGLLSASRLPQRAQQQRHQSVIGRAAGSTEAGPHPVYPGAGKTGTDYPLQLQKFFTNGGVLPAEEVAKLLEDAEKALASKPTLVRVPLDANNGTINVIGDVHGQFFDLQEIFSTAGEPSESNPYLFNGDFVDRGSYSVEVALLLLAWQAALPQHFHLSRGNHEFHSMNQGYGFTAEVLIKYNENGPMIYKLFQSVFKQLPLAHVIGEQVFVVHGGIPRDPKQGLDAIAALERSDEYFDDGGHLAEDLMWSDPRDNEGLVPNRRGAGREFGPDVTQKFLQNNDLRLVIRSHEVRDEGYSVEHNGLLITVFSAPNYCDQVGNAGGIIRLTNANGKVQVNIDRFLPAPRPKNYIRAMEYQYRMGGMR